MNSFNKERNACFGVAFLLMFMIGIYFVHIPWNIDRLNISESQLGFGIFIFGIFNFFSNQMSGRMVVPRIGTTRTIILGIIIFSFCPLLLVSVPNYNTFLISWIPFGISIGLLFPTMQTQISIIEEKTSKIVTPLFQACFSAGSLFGALCAAFFIQNISDPRITFILVGSVFFIYILIILIFGMKKEIEPIQKNIKFKMPAGNIFIYGFLLMMNFATLGIIIDWSPVWLTKDLGAPLYLGGMIILFFNVGEIFARLLASKLINYFNEEIVGGYFSLFSCIILGLSIVTMNLNFIIPGMILFGFGTANFIAVVYRQAIKSSNEPINLTVSNLATLGFAGFIFGPVIVGYMAEYFGLTFNMYVLSVIWAINGLLLLYLMSKNKRKLI